MPSRSSTSRGRRPQVRSPQQRRGVQLVHRFRQSSSSSSPQAHLTHVSTLSGPGIEPVSGQLCGTAGGGASHVSRFPVAFRLPAFASWVILFPLGNWAFLAVGLPGTAPGPQRGCHVPHARDATGLGALCTPGTTVLTRPTLLPGRRLPLPNGQSLHPGPNIHPPGLSITRHHRGFTRVHPSGLPLACSPRMERAPLGFPPELRTPPSPATHVRVGTGTWALARATSPSPTRPPSRSHSLRAPSCRTTRSRLLSPTTRRSSST